MDGTAITLGVLSTLSTLGAAAIAGRANHNARAAHRIGQQNASTLKRLDAMGDRRQQKVIKTAAEAVAREHPELLASAVADEVVRTVLEAILEGHVETHELQNRRLDD